jgi:predicted lactoylglutathione lyase
MRPRISLITLGVRDMERAKSFYEALGWSGTGGTDGQPVFVQAGGDLIFSLWDRAALAKDSEAEDGGAWGGITLAHCVGSREEVDSITNAARDAGATVAREPAETFWGGYDSIVVDPEGHSWEIAHNPHWTMTEDGGVRLPS